MSGQRSSKSLNLHLLGLESDFKNLQTTIILKGQQSSPDCSASVNMKMFAFLRSQAAQETKKIKIMF